MRTIFTAALVFTLIFGGAQWYVQTAGKCPAPIFYSIGSLDERFSVSVGDIRAVALEAEEAWEKAAGRDLFEYKADAPFSINLIYDERQQLAVTEEVWRNELDAMQTESNSLIERVKDLAADYERTQKNFDTAHQRYERRLASYNNKVDDANNAGGAPEPLFTELAQERKALDAELKELLEAEAALTKAAATINDSGNRANALIATYNEQVTKYNEVYGEENIFTQGDFTRDKINIYKFSNIDELRRVIAHEFGHALGIDHVADEEAIMYYLMQEQPSALTVTIDDRDALLVQCGTSVGFSDQIRQIIRTAVTYF